MIKYLHFLRRKKGFTLVEMLTVIGIIGIMLTVILSGYNSDFDKRNAANTRAQDLYTCMQNICTKYQMYEHSLSTALESDDSFIKYDLKYGGNMFTNEFTFIEFCSENDKITYVHAAKSLTALLADNRDESSLNAFEQLLLRDIDNTLDVEQDGYYYALIQSYNPTAGKASYNPIRVTPRIYATHFSETRVPVPSDIDELFFSFSSKFSSGQIVGSCSSEVNGLSYSSGSLIGDMGSYFLGIKDLSSVYPALY